MIIEKRLTWYIAGPMSGRPQFNVPMFDRIAAALRADGYTVISPAELDSPEMRRLCLASTTGDYADLKSAGESWPEVLARDVKLIGDKVDGIIVLPGWEKSRGARLECFVGLLCRKYFAVWDDNAGCALVTVARALDLQDATAAWIRRLIRENMP